MASKNITKYTPGFNINDVQKKFNIKKVIKLSSNENPFVSDKVTKYINNNKHSLNLYPESKPSKLQSIIAKNIGFKMNENNIILGNGSNEILEFIARLTLNSSTEAIIPKHSFLVYEIISKLQDAKIIVSKPDSDKNSANYLGVDLDSVKSKISSKTRLIFLANPANPTGTYIKLSKIDSFLSSLPQKITVIIDEAYYEYLDPKKDKSAISLIKKYKNLFVTRSFSKIYGLASLRIGYGISSEKNIEKLKLYKQPFNTNFFAQKAAEIALNDHNFVSESKQNNNIASAGLIQLFNKLSIRYLGTYCNFITFEVGQNSKALFEYLLKKGIVVRPLANYKLPKYLRVSLGTVKEMDAFKKQLKLFYNAKV